MHGTSEHCAFTPAEIAGESWAIARENWKMFLGWGAMPMALSFLMDFIINEMFLLKDNADADLGGYAVAFFVVCALYGWLGAPYRIRMHRYAAFGERPPVFYGLQLWDERTWRLICKGIAVNIQAAVLSIVVGMVPMIIAGIALRSMGYGNDSSVHQYLFYGVLQSLVWYAANYLMASRLILVYPGVAFGDRYTIAEYGLFGRDCKSSMVKTMLLIWTPAALLGHAIVFANYFVWSGNAWMIRLSGLISTAVWIYTGMASLAAGALIYKRLSPDFPEKAAEHARVLKEIREIGAWKAKGAPEDSRPTPVTVHRQDQPK